MPPILGLRARKVEACPLSPQGITGALISCPYLAGTGICTSQIFLAAVKTQQEISFLLPSLHLLGNKDAIGKGTAVGCKSGYVAQLLGGNGLSWSQSTELDLSRFIICTRLLINCIEGSGSHGSVCDLQGSEKLCVF